MLMLEASQQLPLLILIWCTAIHTTSAQVILSSLQVKTNPIAGGLLVESWFSWTIDSFKHRVVQTSYQLLVSRFRPGDQDVWNSGVILSNKSQLIKYTGPQLIPNAHYTWIVNISTSAGSGLASSEFVTGSSTTGGLTEYGYWAQKRDESLLNNMIQSASWIWTDDGNIFGTPPGDRAFRYIFNGPPGNTILSASVLLCVDDRFTLYVNGYLINTNGNDSSWPQAHWYDITLAPGTTRMVFAIKGTNDDVPFNPLNTAGVLISIQITFGSGASTFLASDENWRSSLTVPDGFESPSFDDALWRPAKVLAKYGEGIWGHLIIFPTNPPASITIPILITTQPSPSQSLTLTLESSIHTPTIALASTIDSPFAKAATLSSSMVSITTSSIATASTTAPLVVPSPTSSTPPGAIIGGIFGSIVLIILVLVGYLWYRRKVRERTNNIQVETAHPFNLKYTESVHTVPNNRRSSVSLLRRPLSTAIPLLTSMMSTVAEWNRRIRGATQSGGNDADFLTGVRLQVVEEQLMALDREINPGDENPEARRVWTNSVVLEAHDDAVTLIGG